MEYQSTPALADDQLIQYYLTSDSDALETLVYLNKDKIYNSILAMVHDKHVADDILQDVFIRIINTLMSGKYVEEGKFLPWAMRIAHNMCIDHFRKAKMTPVLNSTADFTEIIKYSEPDSSHQIMSHESHDQLRRLIDMLPEEQREVIVLRHYADLSFKEIAEIMKCNINTALGRMRYALNNLRRIMEEKQVAI
ncbi:RNA polymerase sigma factor [Ferruginibacter albus]|uniref:RNA polymerase sigma factor n=1 Tax=Ferruginibacter albus TaxID=2875540 RepID=UPI001CC3F1A1|nr:sigma-70 family RNA polymerase sigma factor [Ferruginibacter albus]UAY51973.1 sigma-70 family RNA polymerase sigma factor [Ferruginibacter albus]